MTDVVNKASRSRMMSNIRSKDTKPEIQVRSGLHRLGYRFRLHQRNLPGCPDLVLKKHRVVIFVNGCFWHGHGCHKFKWPKTNMAKWRNKILLNLARDQKIIEESLKEGWRVLVIWECALGSTNATNKTILKAANWIDGNRRKGVLSS